MNRRRVLQWFGAAAGVGVVGRYACLPPGKSGSLDAPGELAIALFESLDDEQRRSACVEYDHPLRQYHNRGVWGGGLWVNPASFGWEQRRIVTDLLHAGLSEAGRQRVPKEFFTHWPGVHAMHVLFCGNPSKPPYQVILTGPHLNLRLGGQSPEGAAFGGPLVYGDQRGDGVPGLPNNLYRDQWLTAQQLFHGLNSEQQHLALHDASPVQTMIGVRGSRGAFTGVQVATLAPEARTCARTLIDQILSTYPADDVAYAWQCLERNGGVEALFLTYYADSAADHQKRYQNFRLEGPAAVFYFRGAPHVHAFINVTMDGDRPLSVGELLAHNTEVLEGAQVKRLFEAAMQAQAGTDVAYFHEDGVAGRLLRGPVRTGDIYALESWQDHVTCVEIRGSHLSATLVEALRRRGIDPDPRKTYSVATTGYVADERAAENLGRVESQSTGGLLRDVTIAHLREHGMPAQS